MAVIRINTEKHIVLIVRISLHMVFYYLKRFSALNISKTTNSGGWTIVMMDVRQLIQNMLND